MVEVTKLPPDWWSGCEQGRVEEQEKGGEAGHHCHRHVRALLAPNTGAHADLSC